MVAPSLDSEFMQLWSKLTVIQKESLLGVIKSFALQYEGVTLEQYNIEIQEAEAEFEKGDFISNEEMIQQVKKW